MPRVGLSVSAAEFRRSSAGSVPVPVAGSVPVSGVGHWGVSSSAAAGTSVGPSQLLELVVSAEDSGIALGTPPPPAVAPDAVRPPTGGNPITEGRSEPVVGADRRGVEVPTGADWDRSGSANCLGNAAEDRCGSSGRLSPG
jgi:hypothetical protein